MSLLGSSPILLKQNTLSFGSLSCDTKVLLRGLELNTEPLQLVMVLGRVRVQRYEGAGTGSERGGGGKGVPLQIGTWRRNVGGFRKFDRRGRHGRRSTFAEKRQDNLGL